MAKKKKLRAGVGAEADIITRYIAPKQPATNDKKHRSDIILIGRYEDEKKKIRYLFHLKCADDTEILQGSKQFIHISKEGDLSQIFEADIVVEEDEIEEPKIGWAKSRARKLLYKDVKEGNVALEAYGEDGKKTTDNKEVYMLHPEYTEWKYKKFSSRLGGIRKIIKAKNGRAEDDQKAFDKFVENNEVSTVSHKGYIQWQGSDAQRLLKKDIKDGILAKYTKENYPKNHKMEFWLTRPEYYNEFPLPVFRDKMRQEIRSAKYIHTLKVRGKAETYKYNN